jgi:hypothetical protein
MALPIPEALRAFGRFAFPRLLATLPAVTASHRHPRELLLELDGTIHKEVRKLWRDARPPRFRVEAAPANGLVLHYDSARGLCPLVEGLLVGAAQHYAVRAKYEHTQCRHRGDAECVFEVQFEDERVAAEGEERRT